MATVEELRIELQDLQTKVWRSLGLRKHLVGRATADEAVVHCIARWPGETLAGTEDAEVSAIWQRELKDYVVAAVAHSGSDKERYGFAIWAVILAAVVSQVIQALLKWWLERRDHRELMDQLRIFRGTV